MIPHTINYSPSAVLFEYFNMLNLSLFNREVTNYSLSTMLETPIQDFKTQLSSLNPEQIDSIVKGWLEECNSIKPGAYRPSELLERAICVLPASSQKHFPALAEAFGCNSMEEQSFTWHKSVVLNSDSGKKHLFAEYSVNLEKTSNLQQELLSLEYALDTGIAPTVKEFEAMLSEELLDCRTPAGKDILEIFTLSKAPKLEELVEPLINYYLKERGTEVFLRRYRYAACKNYHSSPNSPHFFAFVKAVVDIEKAKPLISLEEAWEQIHNNFEDEALYWHHRYDYLITDSVPKAESKLQEELNILAVLLSDSRRGPGSNWPKILEEQKGELRPLLREELLDVRSSRDNDIYDEVLEYGSIKDIEQLLTFVREKRGDEALHKFVQGRTASGIGFIKRGFGEDKHLQQAKQLVALYEKLDLDPKTFTFKRENEYRAMPALVDDPKVLEYLLMLLSEKERYEACKLRGDDLLRRARILCDQEALCEIIDAITGSKKRELLPVF